jgi:tetraacyldisaccharide 4'-kinase
MLSGAEFREIVSGRRRGALAGALRGALGLLEHPYRWVVARRNARFDRDPRAAAKVPALVVSVGNLSVGGTGKTPFVAWLAEWFIERQRAVTIISRGYGSRDGKQNDEAQELAARLPGVPHLQNPDRVAAARQALAEQVGAVLILDDAFQHRRIARDLDIVLLDALEPFGCGHLLPRGLLREPVENLARAQVIGLTRSDAVSGERRREIEAIARKHAPRAVWLELEHRPQALVSAGGKSLTFSEFQEKRVAAFCGIGNPAGFRHTLAGCGLTAVEMLEFPDHCAYGAAEMERLERWLGPLEVGHVLCTRKDLVKIPREAIAGKKLLAVDVRLEITAGRERLEVLLRKLCGFGASR